jgi:hypothetical protein
MFWLLVAAAVVVVDLLAEQTPDTLLAAGVAVLAATHTHLVYPSFRVNQSHTLLGLVEPEVQVGMVFIPAVVMAGLAEQRA